MVWKTASGIWDTKFDKYERVIGWGKELTLVDVSKHWGTYNGKEYTEDEPLYIYSAVAVNGNGEFTLREYELEKKNR